MIGGILWIALFVFGGFFFGNIPGYQTELHIGYLCDYNNLNFAGSDRGYKRKKAKTRPLAGR